MKKFFALAAVAAMVSGFAACGNDDPDPVKVSGVKLNKTTTTLEIGAKETLVATVEPANAADKTVTWTSDKTDVATVTAAGEVTAVAAGTAKITVTTKDGSKTAICDVTVNAPAVSITGSGIGETLKIADAAAAVTTPVVVNVKAKEGIAEFKVQITSTSATFMGSLAGLKLDKEFDLANPNAELTATLAALKGMGVELPSGEGVKGKTTFDFNVTPFTPMIFGVMAAANPAETGCTADFKVTVTDTKDATDTKTVKLELGTVTAK